MVCRMGEGWGRGRGHDQRNGESPRRFTEEVSMSTYDAVLVEVIELPGGAS